MEDLRRRVHEEHQGRRSPPRFTGFKETTFLLSCGSNSGKNPSGKPRPANGNQAPKGAAGPAKSANPKKAKDHSEWKGHRPCHRCSEEGHWMENCLTCSKGEEDQAGTGNTSQQQSSGENQYEPHIELIGEPKKKTTYLTTYWRGKQYNALMDTGCEVSVVGRRLLPDIEMSPPNNDLISHSPMPSTN